MTLSWSKLAARAALTANSKEWRAAFETQCTKELIRKARRVAARRARQVRRVGGVVDDYYVHELVQDILADTSLGILRWDPSTERLEKHVLDAIATRVHHDVAHAKRFPHVSLDDADPDEARATLAAVEATLLAEGEAPAATIRFADESLGELGELAAEDPGVQRILAALAAGATCKDDVMFLTGMSDQEYVAVRHRLDRLARSTPADARPSRPRTKKKVAVRQLTSRAQVTTAASTDVDRRDPAPTGARADDMEPRSVPSEIAHRDAAMTASVGDSHRPSRHAAVPSPLASD